MISQDLESLVLLGSTTSMGNINFLECLVTIGLIDRIRTDQPNEASFSSAPRMTRERWRRIWWMQMTVRCISWSELEQIWGSWCIQGAVKYSSSHYTVWSCQSRGTLMELQYDRREREKSWNGGDTHHHNVLRGDEWWRCSTRQW